MKTSLQVETRTLDLLEVLTSTVWHWQYKHYSARVLSVHTKTILIYVNVGIIPVMNETMLRVVYYVGICRALYQEQEGKNSIPHRNRL